MSLDRDFFLRDAVSVAEDLVGCHLIRYPGENKLILKIVETEAYCGADDKACHAHANKVTDRTEPMFKQGGHLYVYLIYGMYYCFNIVTAHKGSPHAVLIRAGEPLEGIEHMKNNRDLTSPSLKDLASGPGKLCQALKISSELSGVDLFSTCKLEVTKGTKSSNPDLPVEKGKRMNIDYAEEYRKKLWRFYVPGSEHLSQ